MNTKETAAKKVMKMASAAGVFLACLVSILLIITAMTAGDRDFYTENIDNEDTRQAVLAMIENYLSEKSNQTTIPLEIFLEGYDEETVEELISLHTADTVELLFNGTEYPHKRARDMCDFDTPLNAFADEILAGGDYSVSDSDLMHREVAEIAKNNLTYINNVTKIVDLTSLQGSGLLAKLGPLLKNSTIFAVNAILLTILVAFMSCTRLYREHIQHGGYVTFGSMWLASAVVYSIALTFKSLNLRGRIPIEAGTPLHTALVKLLADFESVLMTVSSVCFYVFLVALVAAIWAYVAPKKKTAAPAEDEFIW